MNLRLQTRDTWLQSRWHMICLDLWKLGWNWMTEDTSGSCDIFVWSERWGYKDVNQCTRDAWCRSQACFSSPDFSELQTHTTNWTHALCPPNLNVFQPFLPWEMVPSCSWHKPSHHPWHCPLYNFPYEFISNSTSCASPPFPQPLLESQPPSSIMSPPEWRPHTCSWCLEICSPLRHGKTIFKWKSKYIILSSNPFKGFSLLLRQSPNSLKVANIYGMAWVPTTSGHSLFYSWRSNYTELLFMCRDVCSLLPLIQRILLW